MGFVLGIRDLTLKDLNVFAISFFISLCFFLTGLPIPGVLMLIGAFVLVPVVRLTEYFLSLRTSATTLATVVDYTTSTYRVGHGRYSHQPADYYVVLRPVVEFETKDGMVREDYLIFRNDQLFVVGEEYEICYSVSNPKIFYFTCRKNEIVIRYLCTLGVWGLMLGMMLGIIFFSVYLGSI